MPAEAWGEDEGLRRYVSVEAGSFDLSGEDNVVLGRALAEDLGVEPGDPVRLLTVRPLEGGAFLPRVSRFTVTGIISTGYQELDQLWVFMPLDRGMRVLPPGSSRQLLGIKITDPYALPNPLFSSGRDGDARYLANEIAKVKAKFYLEHKELYF